MKNWVYWVSYINNIVTRDLRIPFLIASVIRVIIQTTNPIDLLNSICYLCLLFYILVRSEKLAANKPYISCLLKKIKNKLPQNELDFFEEFYLFYENVFNK